MGLARWEFHGWFQTVCRQYTQADAFSILETGESPESVLKEYQECTIRVLREHHKSTMSVL